MSATEMSNNLVEIGRILKPFGVKGELKVLFYIDELSDLKNVKEFYIKDRKCEVGFRELTFTSLKFTENPEYAKVIFTEITDRTIAESWRLVPIFMKKEYLISPDDGEYFITDLIDLEAWYQDQKIGSIFNIFEVAGQELFVIKQQDTKQDLAIPFTERYVSSIKIEDKKVFFDNLDELL
ncbi:MAG: 16S rRNA processing protein RimM [Spirochaetota bacterium]|nr:16S rRNA processing protein RimM [Spirochaetota bacterium]